MFEFHFFEEIRGYGHSGGWEKWTAIAAVLTAIVAVLQGIYNGYHNRKLTTRLEHSAQLELNRYLPVLVLKKLKSYDLASYFHAIHPIVVLQGTAIIIKSTVLELKNIKDKSPFLLSELKDLPFPEILSSINEYNIAVITEDQEQEFCKTLTEYFHVEDILKKKEYNIEVDIRLQNGMDFRYFFKVASGCPSFLRVEEINVL